MAEEEQDPERRIRLAAIVRDLQAATSEKSLRDVQAALANTIAIMCLSIDPDTADEVFIYTQNVIGEVYLAMRNRVREGKPPEVMN